MKAAGTDNLDTGVVALECRAPHRLQGFFGVNNMLPGLQVGVRSALRCLLRALSPKVLRASLPSRKPPAPLA